MVRGGTIEGIVTDGSGEPIWNAVVSALQRGGSADKPQAAEQARTDDTGRCRLDSLAEGDYDIVSGDRAIAGSGRR